MHIYVLNPFQASQLEKVNCQFYWQFSLELIYNYIHQNSQIPMKPKLQSRHGCDLYLNTVLNSRHRLGREMQRKTQERMTSLNNKDFKLIRTNTDTKLMIQATRAMKARDVLHHVAQVSHIITLKPTQMCVWIFSPITISPHVRVAKG